MVAVGGIVASGLVLTAEDGPFAPIRVQGPAPRAASSAVPIGLQRAAQRPIVAYITHTPEEAAVARAEIAEADAIAYALGLAYAESMVFIATSAEEVAQMRFVLLTDANQHGWPVEIIERPAR